MPPAEVIFVLIFEFAESDGGVAEFLVTKWRTYEFATLDIDLEEVSVLRFVVETENMARVVIRCLL